MTQRSGRKGKSNIRHAMSMLAVLLLMFTVIWGMNASAFALATADVAQQTVKEVTDTSGSGSEGDAVRNDVAGGNGVSEEANGSAEAETAADNAAEAGVEKAGSTADAGAVAEIQAEPESGEVAASVVEAASGDFKVSYDSSKYSEAPYFLDETTGVLTITGDVTVSMADGKDSTSQRIVVAKDAKLTLDGVTIAASGGPAIKIRSGVKATMLLADGSKNTVTGAENYAGVEVQFENGNKAELTIDGEGSITANGGDKSAGIGGSYINKLDDGTPVSSYCGDIIIKGGTINANGQTGGAGIGSANNNNRNGDGTQNTSASYKMRSTTGGAEMEIGKITIDGGTITATGNGGGAGIGGGNHCDSGVITINGGTIEKASTNEGAGIGAGRGSSNTGGPATEKGHGLYYADVTINGGTIKEAAGGWLSAGIGGAYECDAIITINGGTIEKATGGDGTSGSLYQGAPGIGAGYQGNIKFSMTGGTVVYAEGGTSAPGIGYGAAIEASYGSKRSAEAEHVSAEESIISISGGNIEMAQGGMYAAGIGSGNGCATCNIEITGGSVKAQGYSDPDDLTAGGAGIGSGAGAASGLKYSKDTNETISITGGDVVAIGGWGAAGIGSGASNPLADKITIDLENAKVEAYADGTKFAIDTRQLNPDGSTSSVTEGRDITGNVIQGTFVRPYEDTEEGVDEQETAGLPSIKIIHDASGNTKELTGMPDGYRSFATDVSDTGNYTVYSDECTEVEEKQVGVYFNQWSTENKEDGEIIARNIKYMVTGSGLSDNCYLYPVKTLVISKEVIAAEAIKEDIDHTVKFGLWVGEGDDGHYVQKDGKDWFEPIEIKDGEPQGTAMFANIESGKYGVWELDENGKEIDVSEEPMDIGGGVFLTKVETRHGDSGDNDGIISDDQWVDYVTVINTYEKKEDIRIRINKSIEAYFDADADAEAKTSNATFVFKVEAFGSDASEAIYTNFVSVSFNEFGEAKSEELELKGVSGVTSIKVSEVYGAGYEAQADADGNTTEQTIIVSGEGAAEKSDDGCYEFSFSNKYDETKIVEGSGVLNRYVDKAYVDGSPR